MLVTPVWVIKTAGLLGTKVAYVKASRGHEFDACLIANNLLTAPIIYDPFADAPTLDNADYSVFRPWVNSFFNETTNATSTGFYICSPIEDVYTYYYNPATPQIYINVGFDQPKITRKQKYKYDIKPTQEDPCVYKETGYTKIKSFRRFIL